jgi:hypothetical protein
MNPSKKSPNLSRSLFLCRKAIIQFLRHSHRRIHVLFTVGCQRSGTSLFSWVLEGPHATKISSEAGAFIREAPASLAHQKSLSELKEELARVQAPLVVTKLNEALSADGVGL